MSSSLAVSVKNVSKRYMLYEKPQDRLKHSLFRHFGKNYGHEFWALRNIDFDVHRGEALGIIGRNGSGKSTLLQIVAGTLMATDGEIQVNGRAAALLELGSGFNPEYTGRENVFMNGAILGLSHKEMERRFEEIVAFADIGEFIDQPVRTYSSGMFVRLAFAVTTGMDVDILLIDEALAVGDVFFRQKCYQRLSGLREKGVSIILVSHAMPEVEQFCQRALHLNRGVMVRSGSASEVVKHYYVFEQEDRLAGLHPSATQEINPTAPEVTATSQEPAFWPAPDAFLPISNVAQVSNGWAQCTAVSICDRSGKPCPIFGQGETASFFYEFLLFRDIEVPVGGLEIKNEKGILVHGKTTLEYGSEVPPRVARGSRLRFRQDIALEVAPGEYTFNLGLVAMRFQDYLQRGTYPHAELDAKLNRVCLLPSVAEFTVVFRKIGKGAPLLHHGVANLPGNCQLQVVPPALRTEMN